jgi:hypothetical protein
VCVFTCMVTRAIHPEICEALSTEAFIKCLTRFIARRGSPAVIYSDNGTNFVGTRNMFEDTYKKILDKSQTFLLNKKIIFKTFPSRSPSFGETWKIMVKLFKNYLSIMDGNSNHSYETFETICAKLNCV